MSLSNKQMKTLTTLLENSDCETHKERYEFLKEVIKELVTLQEIEKTNGVFKGEAEVKMFPYTLVPKLDYWKKKHPKTWEKYVTVTERPRTIWNKK